jgi:hypothetical protein
VRACVGFEHRNSSSGGTIDENSYEVLLLPGGGFADGVCERGNRRGGRGSDTCVGSGATIGGTCTPLTNTTSGNIGNTALGQNALGVDTTGHDNTATGFDTLFSNTTGVDNTAIGSQALFFNTGDDNTATGFNALGFNGTGQDNTATGSNALANNDANSNTADGANALLENTSGDVNTAIGIDAVETNTTGSQNTGVGSGALQANTEGGLNTAIGLNSLFRDSVLLGSRAAPSSSGTGVPACEDLARASRHLQVTPSQVESSVPILLVRSPITFPNTADSHVCSGVHSSALR